MDLVDGTRQRFVLDEALVSCVIQDNGVLLAGVVHPGLEARAVVSGAGRVVRRADIDNVALNGLVRQRQEAVCLVCIREYDLAAGHYVGINVNRVDRIRNQNGVVGAEDVEDVAEVALCAVRDEDLIGGELYAVGLVVADQCLVQKAVALLIAVAVERFLLGLILNGCVQRIDNSRYQRTGYVADAQTDNVRLRVRLGILAHLAGDGGEQIALLEIVVVLVSLHCCSGSFSEMPRRTP